VPKLTGLLILLASSTVFAASLDDLKFMTGRWQQDSSQGVAEEWWMAAGGNTKVAAFRWAQGDRIIAIELVIISQEDDGIYLRFKHFRANYVPWEKDEPNTYLLKSVENDEAIFINVAPRQGIPNAMIYRMNNGNLEFRGTDDPNLLQSDDDLVISFSRIDH
jgi:hypothetical protein